MIGGLVKQEQARCTDEQPCERHAHAPATRERLERRVEARLGNPEAGQHRLGSRLGPVAIEVLEAVTQLPVQLGEAGGGGVVGPERSQLLFDLGESVP